MPVQRITTMPNRLLAALMLILLIAGAPVIGAKGQISVTLLGTGAGPGGGGRGMITKRANAITLIEAGGLVLVFDAGRGLVERLAAADERLIGRADKLFLTHLHSDHLTGLADLLLTGSALGRRGALRLWGPPGTEEMARHLEKAFAWDIKYRSNRRRPAASLEPKDVQAGRIFAEAGVTVTAFAVDHWPPRLDASARSQFPALGFRIEHGGRSVTLSGDTRFSENVIRAAKGTDLLIHEVSMTAGRAPAAGRGRRSAHHTSPEQAGEGFRRAQPRLAVYSHIVFGRQGASGGEDALIRRTRTAYNGPLAIGRDMMRIEVGDEVRVLNPN
ncbi:MAG: MBL fold metallo-hydrolase [Rhodospirillaceae bacterium]|nr:MBL fold metallo-hydrolase [Rhodospirillaceae bacterium]